jgi:hypothetical protein
MAASVHGIYAAGGPVEPRIIEVSREEGVGGVLTPTGDEPLLSELLLDLTVMKRASVR